jgi:hypothetical protein
MGLVVLLGSLGDPGGGSAVAAGTTAAKAPAGAVIVVSEGQDTLHAAVALANPGDTLVLQPGVYELSRTVVIDKDLTIQGATNRASDVHIVGMDAEEEFDFEFDKFPDPLDWGHLLFVTSGAQKVSFSNFTIKNAPETIIPEELCEEEPPAGFGLNHSECFGDGIHSDGAAEVVVENVQASLNAGNGIWVDGATSAIFRNVLAVNNGAFGIDIDTAQYFSVRQSTFIANQVSGIEASGHVKGTPRSAYTALAEIDKVEARGNGEIGVEVERFKTATLKGVTCADNREDGFDADRVDRVEISESIFRNNLDDGIELFPAGDGVPPNEQPADFPGSITEVFRNLVFEGNLGEDINRPPTEN